MRGACGNLRLAAGLDSKFILTPINRLGADHSTQFSSVANNPG
jgi:hypothetical protein